MKDLRSVLQLLVVVLVAAVALAAVMTGRSAVEAHYEYEMMVAPKSIHQMVLEMEAAEEPERGSTLLYGAGLLALAGLVFGAMVFAMNGGTALLKELRLGRKKSKARRSTMAPTAMPTAPTAPLLRDAFPPSENYANHSDDYRR